MIKMNCGTLKEINIMYLEISLKNFPTRPNKLTIFNIWTYLVVKNQ